MKVKIHRKSRRNYTSDHRDGKMSRKEGILLPFSSMQDLGS